MLFLISLLIGVVFGLLIFGCVVLLDGAVSRKNMVAPWQKHADVQGRSTGFVRGQLKF